MRLRRLISAALGLTVLALIAFHAAIFWQRIVDATITQPGVLGRWIASAVLLSGLVALGRRVRGRRATLTFWILVALLHFSIPGEERVIDLEGQIATLVEIGVGVVPALVAALLLVAATRHSSKRDHAFRVSLAVFPRSSDVVSPRPSRAPPRT